MSAGEGVQEFPDDRSCPCGRDGTYGECCKRGGAVKFYLTRDGALLKSVCLSEQLEDALAEAHSDFRRVFGRKMESRPGGDRFLLHQYLFSDEDCFRDFLKTAKEAEIPPELAYAFVRTKGVAFTEDTQHMWDIDALDEHQEAVEEFFMLESKGVDPFLFLNGRYDQSREANEIIDELRESCFWSICHLGAALRDHNNKAYQDHAGVFFLNSLYRVLDVQRSIYWMFEDRYSDSVFIFIRFLYEAHLRNTACRADPHLTKSFQAAGQIRRGTVREQRDKRGRVVSLVHDNGERYKPVPNNIEMVKMGARSSLPFEFHNLFYPFVSSYAHPSFDLSLSSFDPTEGFRPHRERNAFEGVQWCAIINAIFFAEASRSVYLRSVRQKDFMRLSKRIARLLLRLVRLGQTKDQYDRLMLVTIDLLEEIARQRA